MILLRANQWDCAQQNHDSLLIYCVPLEDYTQQNLSDYTQQNHDLAALEIFKLALYTYILGKYNEH